MATLRLKKVEFETYEVQLIETVLRKKMKGWQWAIDNKKGDSERFEGNIKKAEVILKKLEEA